jgi:CRISPR/Cas system CSM-associated protein Csm3 (group 7 of RAMP superfamily)
MKFPIRYFARIVIEAETPICIGGDDTDLELDSPVDKDFNGLPYIPGTAISGFLSKKLKTKSPDNHFQLFGGQKYNKSFGSEFISSDAYLMDQKEKVMQKPIIINDDFLKQFLILPVRQHVKINHMGAGTKTGKYDREVVYKGSRFKFEIEVQTNENNDDLWNSILNSFYDDDFYIGAGTTNNFGKLGVVTIHQKMFNVTDDDYQNITVDLNGEIPVLTEHTQLDTANNTYITQTLNLSGDHCFFHFGAGFGDEMVDYINYTERVIVTNNDGLRIFSKPKYVIPGSSIKGAVAHRVAFEWNKKQEDTVEKIVNSNTEDFQKINLEKLKDFEDMILNADDLESIQVAIVKINKYKKSVEVEANALENLFEKYVGEQNPSVATVFGTAKDENKNGKMGNLIIEDIYLSEYLANFIFDHNKIDRYTGGTIDTALFNEKVISPHEVELRIKINNRLSTEMVELLDSVFDQIKTGELQLGGKTTKGFGIFNELKPTTT